MRKRTAGAAPRTLATAIRDVLRRSIVTSGLGILAAPVLAVELPMPCAAGACGTGGPSALVTSGSATYQVAGNTGTVTQTSETATLNWSGFNISADGRVVFAQPTTGSIALNRIFQQTPSEILGSLSTRLLSNPDLPGGSVYLVNPNGLIFGSTARVNAAGILATTLNLSDSTFANGLLSPIQTGLPALTATGANPDARLTVQAGAELATTQANGRILLAARNIDNAGSLRADDGQVIVAAGDSVFLAPPGDANPSLRGLLVEVAVGGTAWNQLTGSLSAPRGNVTVVGLAVNQEGRISATTTVNAGGSVRLLAQDGAVPQSVLQDGISRIVPVAQNAGTLTLGSQSRIEILPEYSSSETAVREQVQETSSVELAGYQIRMRSGASITAPGGSLTAAAAAAPLEIGGGADIDAQISIESGVRIDLSGSDSTRSVADNIVTVELRGSELADNPTQRNGPLRGRTVTVDARAGTSVANVSGSLAGIPETVAQRTSVGGTVTLRSNGGILIGDGAEVDVSGGQTTYTGAVVNTTQLITADGRLVSLRDADPTVSYLGVASPTGTIAHDRWGITERFLNQTTGHYEAGYVTGSSAGSVQLAAPIMAMSGTLLGQAFNGAYQRDAAAPDYALGGRLVLGREGGSAVVSYEAGDIRFANAQPVLDPDTILPIGTPLVLSTGYLEAGGFTRTEIFSDGTVTLQSEVALSLRPGSTFNVQAGQVTVNADIRAPAGELGFAAVETVDSPGTGVAIGEGVTLDVGGVWINELETADAGVPRATLFQDAGSILVSTDPDASVLRIGSGVRLLANGGAYVNRASTLTGGSGGSISLASAGPDSVFDLGAAVELQGYGVNGAHGGAFEFTAGRLSIGNGATWALAQRYDPLDTGSAEFFSLGAALFTDSGFAEFSLVASGGVLATEGDSLVVLPSTRLEPTTNTLQLAPDYAIRRSGDGVVAFSQVVALPAHLRAPTAVQLLVQPNDQSSSFLPYGALRIDAGASIVSAPGSTLRLDNGGGNITIAGALVTPGGRIEVHVGGDPNIDDATYDPDLDLRLAAGAVLDASGISILVPNDTGLLAGEVLAGGQISLTADYGTLLLEPGSLIDVSGTSAALDIATGRAAQPYSREQVASSAGAITLGGADSIGLFGELAARAGSGTTGAAAGGRLDFALVGPTSSAGTRTVVLTDDSVPVASQVVPFGEAAISTAQIRAAGLDDVRLTADDRLLIEAGVGLDLQRRLVLEAPIIAADGAGTVQLAAPYVLLGDIRAPSNDSPAAVAGAGSLSVNADVIDLRGALAFEGFGTVALSGRQDIRFRGIRLPAANAQCSLLFCGHIRVDGDLTLTAGRVYAATGTAFAIDATGEVRLEQAGTPGPLPLSAGSRVTINAADIVQNGALMAPFGTIAMNASNSLNLGAGSLTSVSANGLIVPYGTTNTGGKVWTYGNTPLTAIPERALSLSSANVVLAAGATIDVAGGGDLYAYEFIKGTGGTLDALDAAESGELYAILPSLQSPFGVLDDSLADPALAAGDSIYLEGTAEVPAGYYALLPARYALLEGAYLVERVPEYASVVPGTVTALADGTTVVPGFSTFGTTGLGGTRYAGYAVRPGEWGRELAEYADSFASDFFADGARLVVDAGQLSLTTTSQLSALATVRSQAAEGGTDALIDISAGALEIVGVVDSGTPGTVQLDDDVLTRWAAGSLLLGGSRSNGGASISPTAATVSVRADAALTADEVLLTARESVSVAGRVTSSAAGSAAPVANLDDVTISLSGTGNSGAAVLAVSDLRNIDIQRPVETGVVPGTIGVTAGAAVSTRGMLLVDAPGGAELSGALGGQGATWSLAANQVVFGGVAAPGQLTITDSLQTAMESATALRIASQGSLDFATAVSLGSQASPIDSIELVATALRNVSGGASVEIFAESLELAGLRPVDPGVAPVAGTGSLVLAGANLAVSGAAINVDGFERTELRANESVSVRNSGTLSVGGTLDVLAGYITAASGSSGALVATGDVRLASNQVVGAAVTDLDLGGGLTIQGASITQGTSILAPSGFVRLDAGNSLSIGSGSLIDVSGGAVFAAGVRTNAPGGTVILESGGDLVVANGSSLSMGAVGTEAAGRLVVQAEGRADIAGTLNGRSAAGEGGSFELAAGEVADFAGLNASLQLGGFTGMQHIAVASGDLLLAAGAAATARDVLWSTSGGTVNIAGTVTALSGDSRSSIRLYGTNLVIAGTGALHADAGPESSRGGHIELGAGTAGQIDLQSGAVITTVGTEPGRLTLRAPTVGADDIAITQLAADLSQVGTISLEAVLPAFAVSAAPLAADFLAMQTAANAYIAAAGATVLARLDPSDGIGYLLSPGIEVHRTGDLTLGALDLATWRFGSDAAPAALTVRATGSVTVNGNISDGFVTIGTGTSQRIDLTGTPGAPDRSATLRFAAGSVLDSPNPLSIDRSTPADLTIAAGRSVRTGTGNLSLIAARDVVFGQGAVAFTGGAPALATIATTQYTQIHGVGTSMSFPTEGGQLSIEAARDVIGAALQKTVTTWQPREVTNGLTQWGVDLRQFTWNAGTLGGGDARLVAGRNITHASMAVAESASENPAHTAIDYFGGGSLTIQAGNNLNGGLFYVGPGGATVRADGAVAASSGWRNTQGINLGPLFAMGDASVNVTGRTGVTIAGAVNPTIYGQALSSTTRQQAYFYTFAENSRLSLTSAGGDVVSQQGFGAVNVIPFFGTATAGLGTNVQARIQPASVILRALSENVVLSGATQLAPSDRGTLELFAAGSIGNFTLVMSDVADSALGTPLAPVYVIGATNAHQAGSVNDASAAARHEGDDIPVSITAGNDIFNVTIRVPKSLSMTAGRDLIDLNVSGQNLADDDLTKIMAGRDITWGTGGGITVGGPGRVDILAGRSFDLALSEGIVTTGRLGNPSIASSNGAALALLSGMQSGWNVAAFVDQIVAPSAELGKEMIAYVEGVTGQSGLELAAALATFKALPEDLQRPLVLRQFFATLVQSGREANSDPRLGYSTGYAAIDALLPRNREEDNPYTGDISLAFSRIYTLAGGDINLLIPGGGLNVGLAEPPSGANAKEAGELGIVAQQEGNISIFTNSDVLVNSSRVFTLLGGDVAIWSTLGNIDAGRGAKSSLSVPPPAVLVDDSGNITLDLSGAVSGSGIRTIVTDTTIEPGDVDLIAPAGFVNAGDAGIGSAGNINIAARQVLGVDNIQVGGSSAGVPAATSGIGAALSGVSAVGGAGDTSASESLAEAGETETQDATPLAESALSWLEVFVIGLGEENCGPNDVECLRRQE